MLKEVNQKKQYKHIYRACLYCGKYYKVYPSGFERSKYCSRHCKDSDMFRRGLCREGGRPKGSSNPELLVDLVCPECSKIFTGYKFQNRIYCSKACLKKAITKGLFKGINKGKIPWNKNTKGLFKHTEEFKIKQRNNRLNYMATHNGPFKNTDIEILMKSIFIDNNIDFKQSVRVGKYCVDFLIGNKVVECDGFYWHNRSGDKLRDFIKNSFLVNKGYKVFRFSEYNIKNNINDCLNTIIKF